MLWHSGGGCESRLEEFGFGLRQLSSHLPFFNLEAMPAVAGLEWAKVACAGTTPLLTAAPLLILLSNDLLSQNTSFVGRSSCASPSKISCILLWYSEATYGLQTNRSLSFICGSAGSPILCIKWLPWELSTLLLETWWMKKQTMWGCFFNISLNLKNILRKSGSSQTGVVFPDLDSC